jgi:hypothetical protein
MSIRSKIYYAVLITGQHGRSTCEIRYFTGYSRKAMHKVLSDLAREACGNATCRPLETGIWSIHSQTGLALEAHTYCSASSNKWRTVNRLALKYYDLNAGGLAMAKNHCDTIQADGKIIRKTATP